MNNSSCFKDHNKKIALCLLLIRLTVGLVFLVWTFDKILAPEHAMKVFAGFYGIGISEHVAMGIGVLQLLFVIALITGFKKSITYLLALIFHAGSTLSAFAKYLMPLDNLLFFTAWPMLAALFTLYMLRDDDVLLCFQSKKKAQLTEMQDKSN